MSFFGLIGPPNVEMLKTKRNVPRLIKALIYQKNAIRRGSKAKILRYDRAEEIRRSAAEALGEIGDARAVKALTEAFVTDSYVVRGAAAAALGKVGQASLESLISVLKDPKLGFLWEQAIAALGQIGDPRAAEPMTAMLGEPSLSLHAEEQIRGALVKIGKSAVEPLIAFINDPSRDESHKCRAITCLGKIGNARAVEVLITLLEHSDWSMRHDAMQELGNIGDKRAIEPLVAALLDDSSSVRDNASKALGKIDANWEKSDAAKSAIPMLMAKLKDPNIHDLGAVTQALQRFEPSWATSEEAKAAVPVLVKALAKFTPQYTDTHVEYAMKVLGTIDPNWTKLEGVKPARKALVAAFGNKKRHKRAAMVLGQIGDVTAIEPMAMALYDFKKYDLDTRLAVVEALGKIGDPQAIKQLVEALKDPARFVRAKAASALAGMGWQPDDANQRVYYAIAMENWETAALEGNAAVEPLLSVLNDKIAKRANVSITDVLKQLLETSASAISRENLAAILALRKIIGWRTVYAGCGASDDETYEIDYSHLKQLARQELIRRGENA